ncbi:MAG: molybdate ABC transporter substrate-binding protein [Candidatus Abyssubacteria bacterium]
MWAVCMFVLFLFGQRVAEAGELAVFAGAASKPVVREVAGLFEVETGNRVRIFLGNSGNALFQMKTAKRGDIYFPGSPDFMEQALREGLVIPETVRVVAYLVPAITVYRGNPKRILTLQDLGRSDVRVAIGNPRTVIIGRYAVEILERAGVAGEVRPRIVGYTETCEKAVSLVALKSVDAIVGWQMHDSWNPETIETVLLAPEQVPRISYMPMAVSSLSENVELAMQFIEYTCSHEGKRVFEKYGYLTREEEAREYAPDAVVGGEYSLPEGW